MLSSYRVQAAITPALHGVAAFSETHAIKGVLAIDRMTQRYLLDDEQVAQLLGYYQILTPPTVTGSIAALLDANLAGFGDARLRETIDDGVMPLAYAAAVAWVQRHGVMHLVEAYADIAAHNLDGLGHGWTIWCSFLELAPHLETPSQRTLFAERFAEFVCVQLRVRRSNLLAPVDDSPALRARVLAKPGFFAHSAITLAYVHRHRARLSAAAWGHALATIDATARSARVELAKYVDGAVDEATFAAMAIDALLHGPREAHTVTSVDAMHDLWALGDEPTRRGVLTILRFVRALDLRR